MKKVSLAIAWNWEYDLEFVQSIERECRARDISTFQITENNLRETLAGMKAGRLQMRGFFDRASDEHEGFVPLVALMEQQSAQVLNRHEHLERAKDKATMHLELMSHGLHVPYTIIISPYNHKKEMELSLSQLEQLGRPFIIKPANTTGGGVGVVMGAETLKEVIDTRQHHKNDKYLLQQTIFPASLDGRRAWFRAFYALGETFLCWWDDRTHLYAEVTPEEEKRFALRKMRTMLKTIAEVCRLDFFSSEIAVTSGAPKFVAIDYVNEICDMRLQSKHADGVPDRTVHAIAKQIAEWAMKR